jgi:tetratricopeptide (TPR) repeat protein
MTDSLAVGIGYYETGNLILAQRWFAQAVSDQPHSSDAWIWLGRVLDEAEKKLYCFQMALELDPDSLEAAEAIFALERSGAAAAASTPTPAPAPDGLPPEPSPVFQQPDPDAAAFGVSPSAVVLPPEAQAVRSAPEAPAAPARLPSRTAPRTGSWWRMGTAGLLIGVLLVVFLVSGLLHNGALNAYIAAGTSQAGRVPLTPIPAQAAQITQAATAAQIPASANLTAATAPPLSPQTPTTPPRTDDPLSLLLEQGKFAEAIPLLNQQIAAHPDSGTAYSQRGIAYFRLAQRPLPNNIDEYRSNLSQAIEDLDAAIHLGPVRADDYAYRGMAYAAAANVSAYRVDRDQLNAIAFENLQAAASLGTHLASAPADLAFALVNTGKCDQAQQAAARIASAPPSGAGLAQLYDLTAAIDICQGKLDLAAEAKQKAIEIEKTCSRLTDLAYIQYNPAKPEQALDTLNQCIKSSMDIDGSAYILRALIYYGYGNAALAEKDLLSGAKISWFTGGVSAYVHARLSLEAGQEDKGLGLLQEAEASMTLREGPVLLALAQHDLAVLGASHLSPTPLIPFRSTPLPSSLLTPSSSQP